MPQERNGERPKPSPSWICKRSDVITSATIFLPGGSCQVSCLFTTQALLVRYFVPPLCLSRKKKLCYLNN
jgi:hypothetical protein